MICAPLQVGLQLDKVGKEVLGMAAKVSVTKDVRTPHATFNHTTFTALPVTKKHSVFHAIPHRLGVTAQPRNSPNYA